MVHVKVIAKTNMKVNSLIAKRAIKLVLTESTNTTRNVLITARLKQPFLIPLPSQPPLLNQKPLQLWKKQPLPKSAVAYAIKSSQQILPTVMMTAIALQMLMQVLNSASKTAFKHLK